MIDLFFQMPQLPPIRKDRSKGLAVLENLVELPRLSMNGLIFSSNFIWLPSIVLNLSNLEEKFKQLKMKTDTEIKDLNTVSGILSIGWIRDEEIEYVFLSA